MLFAYHVLCEKRTENISIYRICEATSRNATDMKCSVKLHCGRALIAACPGVNYLAHRSTRSVAVLESFCRDSVWFFNNMGLGEHSAYSEGLFE